MDKKKSDIHSFENLKVWKHARRLQSYISRMVKTFPKLEQYRLVDQMIRSSRSVPRNIAAGYGRYHYPENIQFCLQSRGSLNELFNDLITAYDEKYIEELDYQAVREDINGCLRLLNGYIAYRNKAKKIQNPVRI